jgi:hypothetical protein
MKTKLAHIVFNINKFDRRHIQVAYFVLMLAASIIMRSPSDGGTGPI